jgi:DNA polymerase III alpha subunit
VLRDVGRVLQMPYGQVDRLCKLVPHNPANPVTLAKAIEASRSCAGGATAGSRSSQRCSTSRRSSKASIATPRPTPPAS